MIGLLILSLMPIAIIAIYIYSRDKYEKEPINTLLKALLFGALSVLPIIVAERFMTFIGELSNLTSAAWNAFFVAALCEESFKMLAVYLLIWKKPEFNEKFDGIVYATFVSLGFAAVENILYVMESGYSTGLVRMFTAVPAHAIFGVSMGYFLGLAKFYPKKRNSYMWKAFLLPFILHGLYDFCLMSQNEVLLFLFIPFVAIMWALGFKKLKRLSDSSVYRDDIDLGIDFSKIKDDNKINFDPN